MDVPSLLAATELTHAWVNRRIDLSHTKVVIFGRELAETDFSRHLAPLVRFREFRPTTQVLVANGRAEEVLRAAEPVLETNPGKYWELHTGAWDTTGFIPRNGFLNVNIDNKSPGAAAGVILVGVRRDEGGPPDPTPKSQGSYKAGTIPRRGGPQVDIMGAAVIRNGRMVGVLNGDETAIMKMVRGTFRETIKVVPDPLHPGQFIIVQIFPRQQPEVDVRIGEDGLPRVTARVLLEGNIIFIQSGEHYERPERLRQVERAVEENLRKDARAALDKAQNEFGADFFALGYHAKRLFPTWQAWEDFAWDEKFPEAAVSIDFDFQVRQIGLLRETVPGR
jgi:spore germination protein KC